MPPVGDIRGGIEWDKPPPDAVVQGGPGCSGQERPVRPFVRLLLVASQLQLVKVSLATWTKKVKGNSLPMKGKSRGARPSARAGAVEQCSGLALTAAGPAGSGRAERLSGVAGTPMGRS